MQKSFEKIVSQAANIPDHTISAVIEPQVHKKMRSQVIRTEAMQIHG